MEENKNNKTNETPEEAQVEEQVAQEEQIQDEEQIIEGIPDDDDEITPEQEIEQLQAELEKQKKEYLFLMADFENYRRRTLQEKQDLIKNGGEKVLAGILPVVDDMERAIEAIDKGGDIDSLKEGVDLIYNKLVAFLKSNNVNAIESTGELFDTDLHEAVTTFPAPSEDQKGRVIDTTQRGYTLNDKVLRHAKVVVGQ